MTFVEELYNQVLEGKPLTKADAMRLYEEAPLEELTEKANKIREHFCHNGFDICTIVNAKSGRCSENCRFCAQSAHNPTHVMEYPLLSTDKIVEQAKINEAQGILRYSIVTSGRKLSDEDVDKVCETIRTLKKETNIAICVSFGLLDEKNFRKLKEAGACRVHNNLEAAQSFFPKVCTSHTFEDKVAAIKAAKAAGLSVCSGGIMGLGESPEDRIDMALSLRELDIHSVPINMLNAIPGTPMEHNRRLTNDDMRRIVAVYRFILPDASIRLAGGRGLLPDKGRACFLSGANAAISGDMLTTSGITMATDMKLLQELGYEAKRCHD